MKASNLLFKKNSVWKTLVSETDPGKLSLCPIEAGHFYALSGYAVNREFHDSFLLMYTVKGTGQISCGDASFTLEEGCAALIDCHIPHNYRSEGGEWEFLWMHFTGSMAKERFLMLTGTNGGRTDIGDHEKFLGNLEGIIENIGAGNSLGLFKCEKLITDMFYRMADHAAITGGDSQIEHIISSVAERIDEAFGEDLKVEELAREFGISEYHLIRSFKRIMGVPPYKYLTGRRIAEAKRLLALTDMPVSLIASECGFDDAAGFISLFRKRTGQTPLKYRNNY